MDELKKVKRVIARVLPGAPHEVMLVLDANTGQNALNQVKAFDDAVGATLDTGDFTIAAKEVTTLTDDKGVVGDPDTLTIAIAVTVSK